MREITPALFAKLTGDACDPCDFMLITLVGQSAGYSLAFTNCGEEVTWQPAGWPFVTTFVPFPFTRSELREDIATSADAVADMTITASNVSAQLAGVLNSAISETSKVQLWTTDRSLIDSLVVRPRNACRLALGEIRELHLTDTALSFRIASIMSQSQRVTIPRRSFQASCNYEFGSTACGVDRVNGMDSNGVPFRVTTTVQVGSTASYIVLPLSVMTDFGSPANPNFFFQGADIMMMNGAAGLQAQPIQRVQTVSGEQRFYVRNPFLIAPNAGDTCLVRRWCKKTLVDCQLNQGNINQFGGFPAVPSPIFKPRIVRAPGLFS